MFSKSLPSYHTPRGGYRPAFTSTSIRPISSLGAKLQSGTYRLDLPLKLLSIHFSLLTNIQRRPLPTLPYPASVHLLPPHSLTRLYHLPFIYTTQRAIPRASIRTYRSRSRTHFFSRRLSGPGRISASCAVRPVQIWPRDRRSG